MFQVPGYPFTSLKTRVTVLLLIPVSLLLIAGGVVTFFYTRNLMLEQWNESAALKLARAAHSIEMRLTTPVTILNVLFGDGAEFSGTADDVAGMMKNMKGIVDARFIRDPSYKAPASAMGMMGRRRGSAMGMGFHKSRISSVSEPAFDAALGAKTVTLAIDIQDKDQTPVGVLKIEMGFDYIMEDAVHLGWWHSFSSCLVTREGRYLAHANVDVGDQSVLGETGDPFEKKILEKISFARFGTVSSGEHPPELIAGFHSLESVPWVIILFGKGETVLKPIILYRNLFFAGGVAMVFLILLLIRSHTGRVVGEIEILSDKAGKVADGEYGDPLPVTGRDEISRLVESYNTMIEGLKERDFIRDSFGRYVDPDFARLLMERPDKGRLGGDRRQVVILMSDLRGFTSLTESLAPEIIIDALNRYFSTMIRIIQSSHGIIVDFFGDAVLVFFDPLDTPVAEAAEQAMNCAVAMQESMAGVNRDLVSKGLPALHMGIGLHTGQVVVGNIGSDARAKYGIVGSAVNLTSRIQARAGEGEIVASSDLLTFLPGIRIQKTFEAELKGIKDSVTLNTIGLPE